MKAKNKAKLTGPAIERWWDEWREVYTVSATARFFKTSTRTVRNWLAAGLDNYEPAIGLKVCQKHVEPLRLAERWGISPLGCAVWHIQRLAQGKPHAPAPVVQMLEPIIFRVCYDIAKNVTEPPLAEYPEPTWENVVANNLEFILPGVAWFAETNYWGGPLLLSACELPEYYAPNGE